MEFNRVQTEQQARDLARIMPEVVAIDTEFVKGNPRTTQLLSVIVADSERAWAIDPSLMPILSSTIQARKLVFLQDYNHCDTIILLKNGVDLRETNCHNLIDMHHLINENAEHDLGSRVLLTFGDDYKSKFWNNYKNFEDAPEDESLEYQCKDAIYTYRLGIQDYYSVAVQGRHYNFGSAQNQHQLIGLYEHIRKLSKALLDTELEGLPVNTGLMKQTYVTMKEQIEAFLPKLREEFNVYCNIWELKKWQEEIDKRSSVKGKAGVQRPKYSFTSDAQLRELLYGVEYLDLPINANSKTKRGNPSTSYDTIRELAGSYPQLQTLLEYKDLKGVYSTFVVGMLERLENDRIYPHFNVSGTATGRLSHSDPNMGNLPKDGIIRNFFIPSSGMVIIGADYAQLEVVVELNLTEDPGLKEIVLGGASKHDLFKAELDKAGFNLPRSQVKNVNFALQYDAQAKKISKMVGCSVRDAERMIEVFYTKFVGVKRLKEETKAILARDGKVTNLAGRTRHFTKPTTPWEKAKQERQAYNFLIQGVAAEACNRAYYRFHNWLKKEGNGRGLFSVHDEIVCEVWGQDPQLPYFLMRELEYTMGKSTEDFNFKYPLTAKAYGPFLCWQKT